MLISDDPVTGRYRIVETLGRGSCGVVYLVEDPEVPNVHDALKELNASGLTDEERAEAIHLFKREIEILKSLNHSALPEYVDSFSEGGARYLLMEYIEGENLDKKSPEHPFVV